METLFKCDPYMSLIENTELLNNSITLKKCNLMRTLQTGGESIGDEPVYRVYPNIVSNTMCDYIINESEKHALSQITSDNLSGWTQNRHSNYPTTDLPIRDIPSIYSLVLNLITFDVFPLIAEQYNVNKYFLNCNDIFIVKYSETGQTELTKHKDGCMFSFNILLNHESNFQGGGTVFHYNNSNNIVHNQKGGLLVHSGQVMHSGNKITQGIRYLLVGFVGYLKGYKFDPLNCGIPNTDTIQPNETNLHCWKLNMDATKINQWLDTEFIKKHSSTYFLSANHETSLIESFVKELATFHLTRLQLEVDFERYKIEFWWKNEQPKNKSSVIHSLHSDKDEAHMRRYNELVSPILATVTYLNDSMYPLLLTNTSSEIDNKYTIQLRNGVTLFFPFSLSHISFNGSKLHGVFDVGAHSIENNAPLRKAIMFNIWDSHVHAPMQQMLYRTDALNSQSCKIDVTHTIYSPFRKCIQLPEKSMNEFIQLIISKPLCINAWLKNWYLYEPHHTIVEFDIYAIEE